jgi:hypothetical protein
VSIERHVMHRIEEFFFYLVPIFFDERVVMRDHSRTLVDFRIIVKGMFFKDLMNASIVEQGLNKR